jgi:hypothetical protein
MFTGVLDLPRLVPDALALALGAGLLVWLAACWLSGRKIWTAKTPRPPREEEEKKVNYKLPPSVLGVLGVLAVHPCCGAEGNVSAKAALALAAARRPAAPGCACNGVCACVKGSCRCTPVTACSQKCRCDLAARPRTLKAEDGGPDWIWDEARRGYYRKVTVTTAPAPATSPPVFQAAPAFAPPAFFRPTPMTPAGGGACRGGGWR